MCKNWSENLKERCHVEDLGLGGWVILNWILGKYGGRYGLDLTGSG